MTVLVKFQIKIRFSIELHGNSKLSMTSCPPSSACYQTSDQKITENNKAANEQFEVTTIIIYYESHPPIQFKNVCAINAADATDIK